MRTANDKEYEITLNKFLSLIGKGTSFSITWFTSDLGINSKPLDIGITDYLVEYEFAEYADNDIPNVLGLDWQSRLLILTNKGRKLKDCGSIEEFNRVLQDEEQRRFLLDQTVLRTFWINLCIAISTGVAAVYYFFQLYDQKPHPQIALCLLGIAILIVLSIRWLRYRLTKRLKNRKR